ncbi:6-hydroxymethylpterin diphosphokinase MptE-like protein [Glaciecola siphonariae]|uniref:6-hydroxymethylpterin diphosphokinase MptE-like protein n=1 Tax=Glaciecola siphonariae TaxID=521012 RepID=A0ABV9LYW1_9ALTE
MISTLKNRHLGETCVVVCNGPSLNQTDFTLIREFTCIGLNKIFLGFRKFRFYPKYYVAVNEKVLRQSEAEIKKLNCVKFLSNRCPELFSGNALTHILNTSKPHARFCKDLNLGCEEGWTVTYAALQVAYYLGFRKVIIVGMDHRFTYTGKPNESAIMKGDDINHFAPSYFGGGQEWDNPDLLNSEESYRIARQVFEADGRIIIDATVDGACDIFEKLDLASALKV